MQVSHFSYGENPDQFFRLYRSTSDNFSHGKRLSPVVVLLHGGFFKHKYNVDNSGLISLLPSIICQGAVPCLIEYRRVGGGGGFPNTNDDIIAALNKLFSIHSSENLDMHNVTLLGHSAGGTLALWCCCSAIKTRMRFTPRFCVALAPIGDLCEGQRQRLSDEGDAILNYMNAEPSDEPGSPYRQASPHFLLPLLIPCTIVAGCADVDVPILHVRHFYELVKHMEVKLLVYEEANHFDLISPEHRAWKDILKCMGTPITF